LDTPDIIVIGGGIALATLIGPENVPAEVFDEAALNAALA